MGFADITIAELAEDYQLDVDEVVEMCRTFGIPFETPASFLALEDAKRIILAVRSPRTASIQQPLGEENSDRVQTPQR
ncbi:hypothetical protein [Synechococcus sp. PCC 7336]|uniref:hypothetical protein n=1 Tax=Synechococcus sp. PCC 7336 TaxID=195250 RepID=UPI00034C4529|nr:hypothetical protein [Synechococcus sp. PCC 7336]